MSVASAAGAAYLVAALLFVLALAGLSRHETARTGNTYGIAGMTVALVATVALAVDRGIGTLGIVLLAAAVVAGAAIGLRRAAVVEMTGMPELIALLHSFVGLAAVLVGWNGYLLVERDPTGAEAQALEALGTLGIHRVEVVVGVFIGAVTVTGSLVAHLKLAGRIGSAPLVLPGKNLLNLAALVATVGLGAWFVASPNLVALLAVTAVALAFGWHLIASIGGGDMPVAVSMLNSYSGWAAASAGFLLSNDLLIITGALVGASGAYLSYIMCKAMNRSFVSVIAGGFGIVAASGEEVDHGDHREVTPERVAELLAAASRVVITPGYGMAVAQAQHGVAELTRLLRDRGVDVRFGIHPVAGRLPGHMNVLLAEAKVPVRHRAGAGGGQRRPRRDRRRPRHRRQRHRQPRRHGRPHEPDRRHARAAGVGGGRGRRVQAVDGLGLRGCAEPAVLPREHGDALRRREGTGAGHPAGAVSAVPADAVGGVVPMTVGPVGLEPTTRGVIPGCPGGYARVTFVQVRGLAGPVGLGGRGALGPVT